MPSRRMPAGLITACRPPKVSSACSTMPWTAAREVTLSELDDRLAAGGADLLRHRLGRAGRALVAAGQAPPRSLTTTLAPFAGRDQGAVAADAVAAAGDQHHLARPEHPWRLSPVWKCLNCCRRSIRGGRPCARRETASPRAPVTISAPTPPKTAAPTGPRKRATRPLSNSPSSLEAQMNRVETAATRPRMASGVTSCTRVWRTNTLSMSARAQHRQGDHRQPQRLATGRTPRSPRRRRRRRRT